MQTTWWLPRLLAALLAWAVGGALGFLAGAWLKWPEGGAVIGAALGIGAVILVDVVRVSALMSWLRTGASIEDAPHGGGLWGELVDRIERSLLTRELSLVAEQRRLADFLSAIEASPNGVLLLDHEDHISWCSAVAADHLGLDAQRDVRQAVTNLVRLPAFVTYLQDRQWAEPIQVRTPDGQMTLQMSVRAYGEDLKLVLTQDVTERLRADAMRRDFVANVSHEIRTPLTVLAGFVETMSTLPLTEVERRRVLTLMQQQTGRMQSLVSDLLALARLEGSPRPPTDRWVPLEPLLRRVLDDARTLSSRRHDITLAPLPVPLALAGLEGELLSAVTNLATNAVRYTPSGGCIDIGWRVLGDGSVEIEVADTGPGIAREHLARLSERFYRVDSSRARDTGGTGLGLSIVKHVMQRHGGQLTVDSELGKGSRFKLTMPAGRVRELSPADVGVSA